ncbi:hypothetical protein CICLE_v10033683mg, partial [Citrus x clementina]
NYKLILVIRLLLKLERQYLRSDLSSFKTRPQLLCPDGGTEPYSFEGEEIDGSLKQSSMNCTVWMSS